MAVGRSQECYLSAVSFKGTSDAAIGVVCKYGKYWSGDGKSQEKAFTDTQERDTPERKDIKMTKIGILAASVLLFAGAAWAKDKTRERKAMS